MDFLQPYVNLVKLNFLQAKQNFAANLIILNRELLKSPITSKYYQLLLDARQDLINYDYASIQWKQLVITISLCIFAWELFLEIRQRIALSTKKVPKLLEKVIEEKVFQNAGAYNREKWTLRVFNSFYSTSQLLAAIQYNFLPWLWKYSAIFLKKHAGMSKPTEIWHSIAFVSALILINSGLNVPVSLYSTFVVEARHGMNKTTVTTWVTDQLTMLALSLGIGMPVLAAALKIVQWAGEEFAFYVWIFMVGFQIFFMIIFPTFIQPLFNKFTPLGEGTLKTKIDALAKRLNFPLKKVFVVDGSKRSSHSNAYFFGFFNNKRIVIYDTLIEKSSEEEVVAVLAHELGHWHFNHVLSNLLFVQAQLYVLFHLLQFLITLPAIYIQFGFTDRPIVIGFLLFQFVYAPIDSLMVFVMNFMTRLKEFQADAFAKKLGFAKTLKSGLIKLQKDNLSDMNPDYLYSAYHHSHPTLLESPGCQVIVKFEYILLVEISSDAQDFRSNAKSSLPKMNLPALNSFNSPKNLNLGRDIAAHHNINSEIQSLLMKNKVLEDLLKERDRFIDNQNSEIRVLKNALLHTGKQEERLKSKIQELMGKIRGLEHHRHDYPSIAKDLDPKVKTIAIEDELFALEDLQPIPDDCRSNPQIESKENFAPVSVDLIFQETNIPEVDGNTSSSSRTAEGISKTTPSISKRSLQKKIPEVTLKAKSKQPDPSLHHDRRVSKLIPQWKIAKENANNRNFELHLESSKSRRSPSPTKSMLIHERDALEDELLVQYERLRKLNS